MVTGVGGTGVLTITALVAMAAHIEGKGCATMNQTGLAQKFGAVVSHVRVSEDQEDIKAVRIPAGEADLLLGCDLVVTTTYEAMGKVAQGRTYAVVNEAEVPTAAFVLDPDAKFPTAAMQDKIEAEVARPDAISSMPRALPRRCWGTPSPATCSCWGLPGSVVWCRCLPQALEEAIELNGVAVDFNLQAFLWGRRYANEPEKVVQVLDTPAAKAEPPTLDELIADRQQRLTAYQNPAYARLYQQRVARVRAADPAVMSPTALPLRWRVKLYRLMAYKDEYEVARLYSDGEFQRKLRQKFEGDFELRFNLAPPLFSKRDADSGHLIKQEFGPWMMQAFGLLARLKVLRGTVVDVFGKTEERRQERADLEAYVNLLDMLLAGLNESNYAQALELAGLPAKLRGFGHVKDRSRELLAPQRENLLREFRGEKSGEIVNIVEVH